MNAQKMYCGIDVSSKTLDACYLSADGKKHHLQVSNSRSGYTKLLKSCSADCHFVMESTGVYHLGLMFFLHEKQQRYSVVNPLKIRRYIQMHLERNKSDKKDAFRICEYGIDRAPEQTKMPERAYFESHSLNNAIEDMTQQITRMDNQIHALERSPFDCSDVIKSYRAIIKKLETEKQKLDDKLTAVLSQWQPEVLKQTISVKGIGKRAASELIICTKAFEGMTDYRQLISYAGLSPVEYSSGSSIRGKSHICKRGGKRLRNILYMCALNAKKNNRACRELYDRLVENGKNKKVALIAVCNKLLKQVFGCVKNKTLFDDNFLKNIA